MAQMSIQDFFNAIRDGFYDNNLSMDFGGFKDMICGALPVFGTLATEITDKEDGGKMIILVDVDEADLIMTPNGIEPEDVDTDMTTTICILHLNKDNVIQIVSQHGMGMITPRNKDAHLLLASLIGKKINFEGE